jgi:DNA-binding MarR family transcriptional regulator/MFS family permease
MGGVLITSIGSGQVISRVGRYKAFPIIGTALVVIGFLLLSTMDTRTGGARAALDLLVLGLGLGCVMQVLVLAVQNAVDYSDLGVATSGALLFRSIGGAIGTATFGAIFSHELASSGGRLDPAQVRALPVAAQAAYLQKFTDSLSTVFLVAAAIGVLAFVLSWLLPERPLRATAAASGLSDGLAAPRAPDSLAEIERALGALARRDARRRMYSDLAARAGVDLPPAGVWGLVRISEGHDPVVLAQRHDVPMDRVVGGLELLESEGLVGRRPNGDGDGEGDLALTADGTATLDRLVAARRERLCEQLEGWSPDEHEELARVLTRLARDLVGDARV